MHNIVVFFVISILCIYLSYLDLRTRELSNWVLYGGMVGGLILSFVYQHWNGLITSAISLLVLFFVAWFLFAFRTLESGDGKMIMMIGSYMTFLQGIHILLLSVIIGFLYALPSMLKNKNFNLAIPFAPAIFMAFLLDWVMKW